MVASATPPPDAATALGGPPGDAGAATDAAPSVDAGDDAGDDAGGLAADGVLTLEVHPGLCPPGACRSYTYALRADGKLRGGRRKSDVPAADVTEVFGLAESAFAAKHACIPNGPDRQSQSITLRSRGKTQTARGGCGARFEGVKTRLETLAARD